MKFGTDFTSCWVLNRFQEKYLLELRGEGLKKSVSKPKAKVVARATRATPAAGSIDEDDEMAEVVPEEEEEEEEDEDDDDENEPVLMVHPECDIVTSSMVQVVLVWVG